MRHAFGFFYGLLLTEKESRLRVNDFDSDLKLDVDVRELIGMSLWHWPKSYEDYERKLFCNAVTQGCVVLDVGANIGIYTLLAAKRGARVFSIEADPQNAKELRHNVHLNGFDDRVTIIEMAAADKKDTVTLLHCPGNSGASSLYHGVDSVLIQSDTIDSLGLPPITVCKMDIEGAELAALTGMRKTLEYSPGMKMLIEYNTGLGKTDKLMKLIHELFATVSVARVPHSGKEELLTINQEPPPFCNLWLSR
jgi:FkbM family methyltransferase